jgi:hypothetical protein
MYLLMMNFKNKNSVYRSFSSEMVSNIFRVLAFDFLLVIAASTSNLDETIIVVGAGRNFNF